MRVLCLAAHPEDETRWIVATVACSPRRSESTVQRKRRECIKAAGRLGISDVQSLEYGTMHLNTLPAIELNEAVGRARSSAFGP